MFISKQEKDQMQKSITFLLAETSSLKTEILFLTGKIKALEGIAKSPRRKQSEEEKLEKRRAYARKYYAKKQKAKKVLNVSS